MDRVTFDRGVVIATASDYELQRELEMTLDYIADMRRTSPDYPDPRYGTVRAIVAEQERRSAAGVRVGLRYEELPRALTDVSDSNAHA